MVSIAIKTFGVCNFSRLAVTDWRLWFLALMTATLVFNKNGSISFFTFLSLMFLVCYGLFERKDRDINVA